MDPGGYRHCHRLERECADPGARRRCGADGTAADPAATAVPVARHRCRQRPGFYVQPDGGLV